MLKLAYAADLFRRPHLAASMFRDRAIQFRDRLGWEVEVDEWGHEFDQYDDLNPIYVILTDDIDGSHLGSARLLPTTGRTMLKEHFSDLTDGVQIESPLIWETTRFCLSPALRGDRRASVRAPAAIMWAGCELALRAGVEFYVGVFNAQLERVYRLAGWKPEILGRRWTPEGEICAGLWEVTEEVRDALARRAGTADQPVKVEYFPTETKFPLARTMTTPEAFAATAEVARFL